MHDLREQVDNWKKALTERIESVDTKTTQQMTSLARSQDATAADTAALKAASSAHGEVLEKLDPLANGTKTRLDAVASDTVVSSKASRPYPPPLGTRPGDAGLESERATRAARSALTPQNPQQSAVTAHGSRLESIEQTLAQTRSSVAAAEACRHNKHKIGGPSAPWTSAESGDLGLYLFP